jgi:xylulokinase
VFGKALVLPAEPEAAMLGAAICAASGAGLHSGLVTAAHAMVRPAERVEPDAKAHEQYEPYYDEYRRGYPLLRESLHRLARLSAEEQKTSQWADGS